MIIEETYPQPIFEVDLPFGRMTQMESIKAQRARLKQNQKPKAKKAGGAHMQRTVKDDKYSYHDPGTDTRLPVGIKHVQ